MFLPGGFVSWTPFSASREIEVVRGGPRQLSKRVTQRRVAMGEVGKLVRDKTSIREEKAVQRRRESVSDIF